MDKYPQRLGVIKEMNQILKVLAARYPITGETVMYPAYYSGERYGETEG